MLANRARATPKVALATKRGGRAGLPLEPRIVGGDGRPKGFERGLGINHGFGGVRRPLGFQGFASRASLRIFSRPAYSKSAHGPATRSAHCVVQWLSITCFCAGDIASYFALFITQAKVVV